MSNSSGVDIKILTYVCTKFMTKNGWSLIRVHIFVNGLWVGSTQPSNTECDVQVLNFLKERTFKLKGKSITDEYPYRQFEKQDAMYDGIIVWVGRKKDL